MIGRKLHDISITRMTTGRLIRNAIARFFTPHRPASRLTATTRNSIAPTRRLSRRILVSAYRSRRQTRRRVCSFIDITERRLAEEQQGLLLRRWTTGSRICSRSSAASLRSAPALPKLERARRADTGRLGALANAHRLIRAAGPGMAPNRRHRWRTRPNDPGALYCLGRRGGRGDRPYPDRRPEISLASEAATVLRLYFMSSHECGQIRALSLPGGRVRVSWAVGGKT